MRPPPSIAPAATFVLTVALAASVLAAPAGATGIDGGSADVRITEGLSKRLDGREVTVTPSGAGRRQGPAISLPVYEGQVEGADVLGVAQMRGGLRLTAGGRSVTIDRLSLSTRHRRIRGRLAGEEAVKIATFPRHSAGRHGYVAAIGVAGSRLTARAARMLNDALAIPGLFRGGTRFLSFGIDAELATIKAESGSLDITLDPGFSAKLAALGSTPTALPPTVQVPGSPASFAIPGLFGAVGRSLGQGNLYSEAGIAFTPGPYPGAREVTFARISINLDAGAARAWFRIRPPSSAEELPLTSVSFAAVTPLEAPSGALVAPPQPVTLTGYAAEWLNAGLAGPSDTEIRFRAGEPFAAIGFTIVPG